MDTSSVESEYEGIRAQSSSKTYGIDPDANIVAAASMLYAFLEWNAMQSYFESEGFSVTVPAIAKGTPWQNKIISIKYQENCNKWHSVWQLEARGVELYLSDSDEICVLSGKLLRGPEGLTSTQLKTVSSTQDLDSVHDSSLAIFPSIHQDVMLKLRSRSSKPLTNRWVLTSKVDGSMVCVNIHDPESEMGKMLIELITGFGDDFAKKCLSIGLSMGAVIKIGTQSAFTVSPDMQSYVVTTILADCGMNTFAINECAATMTCTDALDKCELFFAKCIQLRDFNMVPGATGNTLIFEAVCQDRRDAWKRRIHTELAVSYPASFMRLLGLSTSFPGSFVHRPHFDIVNSGLFKVPVWWEIYSVDVITDMVDSLSDVIRGKMTVTEYMELYPPSVDFSADSTYFDSEGFVLYVMNNSKWINLKIKSIEYYNTHKYHSIEYYNAHADKADYLIALSREARGRFPLADVVAAFFTDLPERLNMFCTNVCRELITYGPTRMAMIARFPGQTRTTFLSKNLDVQCKMLINSHFPEFDALMLTCFATSFPELGTIVLPQDGSKQSTMPALKTILMKVQPWKHDFDVRTYDLTSLLDDLFTFCVSVAAPTGS